MNSDISMILHILQSHNAGRGYHGDGATTPMSDHPPPNYSHVNSPSDSEEKFSHSQSLHRQDRVQEATDESPWEQRRVANLPLTAGQVTLSERSKSASSSPNKDSVADNQPNLERLLPSPDTNLEQSPSREVKAPLVEEELSLLGPELPVPVVEEELSSLAQERTECGGGDRNNEAACDMEKSEVKSSGVTESGITQSGGDNSVDNQTKDSKQSDSAKPSGITASGQLYSDLSPQTRRRLGIPLELDHKQTFV